MMGRPVGAFPFCGLLSIPVNTSSGGLIDYPECFLDGIRTLPHVVFTLFIIPLLVALNKARSSRVHARTWVHFPQHDLRWLLTFTLVIVDVLAVAEGLLSDSLYQGSHLHLYLPGIISLIGAAMAITYYHNVEVWNSPWFLILLVVYWLASACTEAVKAIYLWYQTPETILREHLTRIVCVLYAASFLFELSVWFRLRYLCFKRPVVLNPPEELVHLRYTHDSVSLLSRASFAWLRTLILKGFHGYIDWRYLDNLPKADRADHSGQEDVLKSDFVKQLSGGVTWHQLFDRRVLNLTMGDLAVLVLCLVLSQTFIILLPLLVGFVALYVEDKNHYPTGNFSLTAEVRYVQAADYLRNGYVLVTMVTLLLVVITVTREAYRNTVTRAGLRLHNTIKMVLLSKLVRLRLGSLPGHTQARELAHSVVHQDLSQAVMLPFVVGSFLIKFAVFIAVLCYFLGLIGLVALIPLLVFPYAGIFTAPSGLTVDNMLRNMRQIKLQGLVTAAGEEVSADCMRINQALKTHAVLNALYGFGVNTLPVILTLLVVSLYRWQYDAPPPPAYLVAGVLYFYVIKTMLADHMDFVRAWEARKHVKWVRDILALTEVVGRQTLNQQIIIVNEEKPSSPAEPVMFGLELRSRSPSPSRSRLHKVSEALESQTDTKSPTIEAVLPRSPSPSRSGLHSVAEEIQSPTEAKSPTSKVVSPRSPSPSLGLHKVTEELEPQIEAKSPTSEAVSPTDSNGGLQFMEITKPDEQTDLSPSSLQKSPDVASHPFRVEHVKCQDVAGTDIELTEISPMLGTIREEDPCVLPGVIVGGKHVTFRRPSPVPGHSPSSPPGGNDNGGPAALTGDKKPDLGYLRQHSSGGFSEYSEQDSLTCNSSQREVGVALQVQRGESMGVIPLIDINMQADSGKLTIITGPRMAGKRSLLDELMLGNTAAVGGDILWKSGMTVSYAGYPAWIQETTLLENIVFGQKLDRHRYRRVVKACLLESDIEALPNKDLTVIGPRGPVMLTDGQKNRIGLARALYSKSDIVLLNEPLSNVNVNIGSQVFEEGILKFLLRRKRTVIIATQQIQFLPFADMIYYLDEGRITHSGTLQEIKMTDPHLFAAWQQKAKIIRKESYANLSLALTVGAATSPRKENRNSGGGITPVDQIRCAVSPSKVRYASQVSTGSEASDVSETTRSSQMYSTQSSRELQDDLLDPHEKGPVQHSLEGGPVKNNMNSVLARVLWFYLKRCWPLCVCLLLIPVLIGWNIAMYVYVFVWSDLRDHLQAAASNATNDTVAVDPRGSYWLYFVSFCVSMCLLSLGYLCLHISVSFCGVRVANTTWLSVSQELVANSPIRDMTAPLQQLVADFDVVLHYTAFQRLGETLLHGLQYVCLVIGGAVVICVASVYATIPLLLLTGPQLLLLAAHHRTARQLYGLQSIAQRKLLSGVYDLLSGLTRIRAFSQESYMLKMAADRLNAVTNTKLWLQALDCWLRVRIKLFTSLMYLCVGFCLIYQASPREELIPRSVRSSLSPAFTNTALILSLVLYYGHDYLLDSISELKNTSAVIGQTHRIINLLSETHKTGSTGEELPDGWPSHGEVTFTGLSLAYTPQATPVLQGVTLHIDAGDKVGVCGPPGSGKSCLLLSLVGGACVTEGEIHVDGQNLSRHTDRSLCERVAVIPQHATVLNNSIRFYLDSEGIMSDVDLWSALQKTDLKCVVEILPGQLDEVISEDSLTSTDIQLLLLCWAVIKASRLVILDAAICPENSIVRQVLESLFSDEWKHTTVIIATNQADYLLTVNKVVVLDSAGTMVEHGNPVTLLANKSVHFPPTCCQ